MKWTRESAGPSPRRSGASRQYEQRLEYITMTNDGNLSVDVRTRPRWTNKFNIDPTIAAAITHGEFYLTPSSDFTVTELIKPPQVNALSMVHAHELQEDVSGRLWALLGSAVHEIMHRGAEKLGLGIAEERLEGSFPVLYPTDETVDAVTVSGKSDIWYEKVPDGAEWDERLEMWRPWFRDGEENAKPGLGDFKVTSVWAYVYRDKVEWETQLNMYAYLWRLAGYPVERLVVLGILRDFLDRKGLDSEEKNARGEFDNYPYSPFGRMEIPLWDDRRCRDEFIKRIELQLAARQGRPRECNDEERFKKADQWAVMRYTAAGKLQKRASALRDDEAEAGEILSREIGNYSHTERRPKDNATVLVGDKGAGFLDIRKGEDGIKCARYCPVLEWCDQGKGILNGS